MLFDNYLITILTSLGIIFAKRYYRLSDFLSILIIVNVLLIESENRNYDFAWLLEIFDSCDISEGYCNPISFFLKYTSLYLEIPLSILLPIIWSFLIFITVILINSIIKKIYFINNANNNQKYENATSIATLVIFSPFFTYSLIFTFRTLVSISLCLFSLYLTFNKYKLSRLLSIFFALLSFLIHPASLIIAVFLFYYLFRDSKNQLNNYFFYIGKFLLYLAIIFTFITLIFGDLILNLILNNYIYLFSQDLLLYQGQSEFGKVTFFFVFLNIIYYLIFKNYLLSNTYSGFFLCLASIYNGLAILIYYLSPIAGFRLYLIADFLFIIGILIYYNLSIKKISYFSSIKFRYLFIAKFIIFIIWGYFASWPL